MSSGARFSLTVGRQMAGSPLPPGPTFEVTGISAALAQDLTATFGPRGFAARCLTWPEAGIEGLPFNGSASGHRSLVDLEDTLCAVREVTGSCSPTQARAIGAAARRLQRLDTEVLGALRDACRKGRLCEPAARAACTPGPEISVALAGAPQAVRERAGKWLVTAPLTTSPHVRVCSISSLLASYGSSPFADLLPEPETAWVNLSASASGLTMLEETLGSGDPEDLVPLGLV